MSKKFWLILATILVAFGFLFFAARNDTANAPNSSKSSASNGTEHIKGEGKANVKLVEYGDYQCPACEQYEPVVAQLFEENKEQIYFQFRNFPLTSLHQNAFAAARAAEAAAMQNKFWEMHDLLYQPNNWQQWTQSNRATTLFNSYAKQLNLDLDKFKDDFSSKKVNDLINADLKAGEELGVTGTPGFFLNGEKITPADSDEFNKLIQQAIKDATPKKAS